MKNIYVLILGIILLSQINTQAQPWLQNNQLFNPGGIPSLPFSQPRFCDLDNDGDLDMILGNTSTQPLYLENTGSSTSPSLQLGASIFAMVDPLDAEMAVFADLDNDADYDMIAGGFTGINLYENTGSVDNPYFEQVTGFFSDVVVGNNPVPAFADIDGDNDLDMAVGFSENGMVKIYENTGSSEMAVFNEGDSRELGDVGLFAYPIFCDLDADLDADLLVGKDTYGFVYYQNNGTTTQPNFETNNGVIAGLGADTYWNSPALVDINGDQTFDLIYGTSSDPLKYFENTGSETTPSWTENTTLFGGVIDVGGASNPVFYDFDNDMDLDMFTGTQMGDIKYFENTGNPFGPSWQENSTPFASLKHSIYSAVAIGDVNNDGNADAIVGDLSGKLYYHRNAGLFFVFESTFLTNINLGGWSAPRLVDFDGDLDLDIIAGAENGTISYIENQGNAENPNWNLVSGVFAGIDVGSNCVPSPADLDFDSDLDLVCGDLFGDLAYYENAGGQWTEHMNFFLGMSVDQNATPALADLDNDGDPDLAIGEYAGTFSYYQNRIMVLGNQNPDNSDPEENLQVFPNPASQLIMVNFSLTESSEISIKLIDAGTSRETNIYSAFFNSGAYQLPIDLTTVKPGFYILSLKTNRGTFNIKLIRI